MYPVEEASNLLVYLISS